ncbi:hypothetical protein [Capnocytophaga catalasegens]|uniref:Uncharacterized protein n=1 Tax=Capnocytophaga catalasegens TaxID=1004260 RepID=A0AAV5ASX4_9FLAO|nr:hypothetical protein [Capnocytophaga catalasegens]GIZ15957.1 hypothetical protein RCZ03_19570 [Capnocytophaga catalasegens]GJM50444.1 hypothetical protein RCZ15_14170 [Capnocytophaga catalasegens]GJM53939.1 hypothetical protein RCZ16_22550 [Capnocytophaga catalasegens]
MKYILFIILSCSIFLVACQKHTSEFPNQEQSVTDSLIQKSYSIDKLPFEKEKLEQLLRSSVREKQGELPISAYGIENNLSLGNEVVENSYNQTTTYSIGINEKKSSDNSFKNLVIEKSENKEATYLITYHPSETYTKAVKKGFIDTPYQGTYDVKLLSLYDKDLGKENKDAIVSICVTTTVAVRCTAGGRHHPNEAHQCKGTPEQKPRWDTRTTCTTISNRGNGAGPVLPEEPNFDAMIDRNGSSSASPPASAPPKPLKDIENKTPRYDCLDPNCKSVSYYDPMVISPILYSFPTELYELKALLDEDVFIWIGETMSPTKISQLVALFNNSDFNTKVSIIERIKNARKNGINANDIVFDIPEQIFDNITNPKIKCIHDKLRYGENDYVKQILDKFEGDGTDFDIIISSRDKVITPDGRDVNGITRYTEGNKNIYIEISISKSDSRSVLDVARTIFHEYIHADIFRKLKNPKKVIRDDFESVLSQYALERGSDQHDIMANLYIPLLQNAMRQFHQQQMPREYKYIKDKFFNNRLTEDLFYEALAWRGISMYGMTAYTNMPQDKREIIEKDATQVIVYDLTKNAPCK